jgi:hypothetical protein
MAISRHPVIDTSKKVKPIKCYPKKKKSSPSLARTPLTLNGNTTHILTSRDFEQDGLRSQAKRPNILITTPSRFTGKNNRHGKQTELDNATRSQTHLHYKIVLFLSHKLVPTSPAGTF